jgi:ribose transport system ATP-binding protein
MDQAIEIRGLTKRFGPTAALSEVTFNVRLGDIHALVGENGAGKSSLIKILSGVHQADEGAIHLFGETYAPSSPTSAQHSGVSTMFQESQSVSNLSVAENIFIGIEPKTGLFLNWKRLRSDAGELLTRLGIPINPLQRMGTLTPSEAKLIEMARAVSRNAKVLIMDEPTANLNAVEQKILFNVMRNLNQKEGVTIIYISHHLQEVFDLCKRVTVLRDGRHIETLEVAATDQDRLVELMIGRQMESFYPHFSATPGRTRLSIEEISQPENGLHKVSFEVGAGEIYGLYGLADSGRTALVNVLFGIVPGADGQIKLDDAIYRPRSPSEAIQSGVVLVPEDRKTQGLMLDLDLLHNLSAANFSKFSRNGFFSKGAAVAAATANISKLKVKPSNYRAIARGLSGGNQQKIAIGKWLNRSFKLAIFQEPTRGIDVGAKMEVYNLVKELSESGVAVIMISSEVMELMGTCHRIGVLADGRIDQEFTRAEFTERTIVTAALPKRRH